MSDSPSGLLLFDKPAGITSYDAVHVAKRRFGVRVGHCGTLDPAARGLLLLLIGSSTRAQDSFMGLEKEYGFRAELGRRTSTGDREGEVVETQPYDHVTETVLTDTLRRFVGDIEQKPPVYSALKYKGKPYYHYARKGIEIPRPVRSVHIYSLSLLAFEPPFWNGLMTCSRGTYVRTLVEDVAIALNTCGTLTELVRERIGTYHRTAALSWDALRSADVADLNAALLPAEPAGSLIHA